MGRASVAAWLGVAAPLLGVAVVIGVLTGLIRGALVRDLLGPAIVSVALAGAGSYHFSRTVRGWPRAALRTWAGAWIGFLGLLGVSIGLAVAVLGLLLPAARWQFALAVLRFGLLSVGGALMLATAGRLLARRDPTSRPPSRPP